MQIATATWQSPVLGNPLWSWILALAIPALLTAVIAVLRKFGASRAGSADWRGTLGDLARGLRLWLVMLWALFLGSQAVMLPGAVARGLQIASVAAIALQFMLWSPVLVDRGIRLLLSRTAQDGTPDQTLVSSSGVLRFIGVLALCVLVVLLALDNLGVKITPLIAGLGVGGIAVALAVQSLLGDIFASLSILLDKPFVVGDFIIVDDKMGTVEKIGIKTTRVRALSGEQLVFANSDLLGSRVQNFKRMQERRAVFSIGVVYHTPPEKLRQIPRIIREAIEHNPETRFDRCHFKAFGDYSLQFECVYFVLKPDFNVYMDTQQAVNLEIFERFAVEGIEFAYPTQVEIQMDGTPKKP